MRTILPRQQWQRNQIAVNVAACLVFMGFNVVMPFLPFYVSSLGVREPEKVALWSGLLLTVSPLLASVLGPMWGRLADRVGMKIMVQRVLFTIALHWGLMYFTRSVWHLLALRIMLGVFSGFGTMSVALVTHGCPQDKIGRAVGTLQSTQILSSAAGPFVGGILANTIGIRSAFLVTCALCTGALFFVIALFRDTAAASVEPPAAAVVVAQEGPVTAGVRAVIAPSPEAAGDARPLSFREILALPMFLSLLPILFLVNLVDRFLYLVVPLYLGALAGEGGTAEATTGFVVSAGAFASAASAYLLGRRATRFPPLPVMSVALLGGTATILPMALCRSVPPFAILRVLLGLATGGVLTLAYTLAGRHIPNPVRASAYGILSSTAMLGGSLGPILCSFLVSYDLKAPFLAGGLVYFGVFLLLWRSAVVARRTAWTSPSTAVRPNAERS
jgi:DHA1 family multidrug resistance protein-like MFS transporter